MESNNKVESTIIVIFGYTGDLTWLKLILALYILYLDNKMPEYFFILGVGHAAFQDDEFRKHLHKGVNAFSRRGNTKKSKWDAFASCISYTKGNFKNISIFEYFLKIEK